MSDAIGPPDARPDPAGRTGAPDAGAETSAAGEAAQRARRLRIEALKRELVGGDLFSAVEVAEILDVHPRTVSEYVREGRLKALQLGGGWKISESALRAFVRDQTQDQAQQRFMDQGSPVAVDATPVDATPGASAARPPGRPSPYKCSFCGKSQQQVRRLIAGPHQVYICNECVALCSQIIGEEEAKARP